MATKQIMMSYFCEEPNSTLPSYVSKKPSKNIVTNIKTFEQYDNIIDTRQRAPGEVSILIRKDIPQNKININTHLQTIAVSATLHKTVTICSLYIPPHNPINENELNNLIEQLPKPFILM